MLFTKAIEGGIRVTGFLDNPAIVLVPCKSREGARRTLPLECNERGFFTRELTAKGFEPYGLPIVLKTERTLYVHRLVKNAGDIQDWFRSQGMERMLPPDDMHVTIAYSKRRVDWEAIGPEAAEDLELEPSLRRSVIPLGDKGAVVLKVSSPELQARWENFVSKGASWEYDGYRPHVTLTYDAVDAGRFVPFPGRIVLGPEKFAEVKENWSPTLKAIRERGV